MDAVVPEFVTWYTYLLKEARKKGNRSLVRRLLQMGRSSNSAQKSRNRFKIRYVLATNPGGLTVTELRHRLGLSREAVYRALKDLRKNRSVLSKRERKDTNSLFERSFAVYHLTEKGKKGIVLPSDRPESARARALIDSPMLERDRYGHWRRPKSDPIH